GLVRRLPDEDASDDHWRYGEGERVNRRRFIIGAVGALAGGSAGAFVAKRYGWIPPDHDGVFGIGETLTYAAHRALLHQQPLAREFSRNQISANFPAINTTMPEG